MQSSGQDQMNELQYLLNKTNKAIDILARNGQKLAQAEMEYRMALAKDILMQREKGTPVTIINDICRGESKIATLRFNRDVAQSVYDANLEAIQAWKMQARLMDAQIGREWGRKEA